MKHKLLLLTFLLTALTVVPAFAQEEKDEADDLFHHEVDSAMAISPDYLPTSYTRCGTTFFQPIDYKEIDTTIGFVYQYDPLFRNENIYQTLGILGQAHKPMNFTFTKQAGFSLLTTPYPLYFKNQTDLKYYKLKTSYTQLAYTYGYETENTLYATHAQNIRNLFNIAFNLRGYTNEGYFSNQHMRDIVADILCHFQTKNELYGFRLSYIINFFNAQENGGLLNVQDFYDHTAKLLSGYNMKLYDATSRTITHDLMFQQYLNIKSKKKKSENGGEHHWGTFTHTFQFRQQSYLYTDSPTDSLFYPNIYSLPTDSITDSLSFYTISNTIQYSTFQPYKEPANPNNFIHFTGGITHEYTHFQSDFYFGHSYTPFAQTHIRLFKIIDLQAKLAYTLGRKPKEESRAAVAYGCYQQNDLSFSAAISAKLDKKHLNAIGCDFDFFYLSPDYIFSRFSSDQFFWNHKWKKENIIRLTPYWQYKDYRVEFSYYMLHNYVYFNEELEPTLLDAYANIIQLHAYVPFRYKGLGIIFNGYLQYSNKEVIQVPLFAGKLDVFYRFNIFKNKAQLQLGLNAAYNTNYYADAYHPLLHQFYHQHEVKTGNYCYLDIYLAIRVKRINLFIKGTHLLSGLMGYHYFTTPDYPMQSRSFALGITWRFHD